MINTMNDYALNMERKREIIRELKVRNKELENFLDVARIPDTQEWLRKELKGEDND